MVGLDEVISVDQISVAIIAQGAVYHPCNIIFYNYMLHIMWQWQVEYTGLILGLRPANERRCYKVTPSLIGWAQT